MFAEDTIAIKRHKFVDDVAQSSRQHAGDSRQTPNPAQLRQHVQDRIRARQQSFVRSLVVLHYIDGVEVVRIHAMTRHQAIREFALQRSKPKTIFRVTFQQKLNEVVTQSANAVVKNDWIGIGCRHGVRY